MLVNVALMRLVPVGEMAAMESVPGEGMRRVFGERGESIMLAIAMLVCLGALSSTVLATIRVTYALARDGLAFRFMSRMSGSQAPVPALIVVAGFAVVLVLNREFTQVLEIPPCRERETRSGSQTQARTGPHWRRSRSPKPE